MNQSKRSAVIGLSLSLGLTMLIGEIACQKAFAQEDSVSGSRTIIQSTTSSSKSGGDGTGGSSSSSVETSGVGFKGANVFKPKYKERIGTYTEQIEMGSKKGWLTATEVESFKKRLEEMKQLEAAAAAKSWQKADVDHIDKVFTKFNMDLSSASSKPAGSAPAATSTAKPAGTVASGETKPKATTSKATTTKSTKKTTTKAAPKAKKP